MKNIFKILLLISITISIFNPILILAEEEEVTAELIDDIKENHIEWKDKIVKIWLYRYRSHVITQLDENRYWVYLYDRKWNKIYVECDKRGKEYLKKKRSRLLYTRLRFDDVKYIDSLGRERTREKPWLELIASRKHKKIGGKVEYLW